MKSSYMRKVSSRSAPKGSKGSAPPTLAEYQDKIRTAGLRSTAPRVAVLRELEAATAPLSHADLVDSLGSQGYDRVTIYRNLTDLTEAGLVVRADLGDHVWRFELRRAGKEHTGPTRTSPAPTAAPSPACPGVRPHHLRQGRPQGHRRARRGGAPARPLRPLHLSSSAHTRSAPLSTR